ncbi:hypothetical protein PV327_000053 [Microctonus hyperodae]|uniref:Uncharacterized protein n=1 Tax=Microctonus hyperodae TaxID=165561 RepID=A0AA39G5V4_MICHY|nr:hypothetical protein PV327_000053 [Microctonus hyperodae]
MGKSVRTHSERFGSGYIWISRDPESVGSPKRRIYKSSLQENTSFETVQRTTKTTTTSATRILTSETKRNGTAFGRHELVPINYTVEQCIDDIDRAWNNTVSTPRWSTRLITYHGRRRPS